MRTYYVYILANRSRHLCMGVTRDLLHRLYRHRSFLQASYTRDFRIVRLVYFEAMTDIRTAIAREQQLKRWLRWRKIRLIERNNAGWRDLSADWFPDDRRDLGSTAPGEA